MSSADASANEQITKEAKESADELHYNDDTCKVAWDDVSGAWLNPRMVEEARMAEME